MTKACHTLETGSTFLPAPFARTRTGKKGAMPHFGDRFNVFTCTIRKYTHWKKKTLHDKGMPHFGDRFNVFTCTICKNTHWKKRGHATLWSQVQRSYLHHSQEHALEKKGAMPRFLKA